MSNSNQKIFFKITKGPHKGEVYNLTGQNEIILGRDNSCQICLQNDKRISRQHVRIYYSSKNELIIQNISERNQLQRNKKIIKASRLKNKDKIRLGITEIEIHIGQSKSSSKSDSPSRKTRPNNKQFSISPLTMIVIALVIGLVYISTGSKKIEDEVDRSIASTSSEKLEIQNFPKAPKYVMNVQAESAYIRGFRDFKKGQYERSVPHFQNCLALDPNHQLCNRYITLSRKKIEELIQYNMITGRKYLSQKQYQSCSSTFRNATFLIANPQDSLFKEALNNYKYCESMQKRSF